MSKISFSDFHNAVEEEKERRDRIIELQKLEIVREYLKVSNRWPIETDSSDIRDIVKYLLDHYSIVDGTQRIYLCVDAFNRQKSVKPDDPSAIAKNYRDIEMEFEFVEAVKPGFENPYKYDFFRHCSFDRPHIGDFEREHIVLNPYNNNIENLDAYKRIRLNYFQYYAQSGNQEEAIYRLLKKYPRMKQR